MGFGAKEMAHGKEAFDVLEEFRQREILEISRDEGIHPHAFTLLCLRAALRVHPVFPLPSASEREFP